MDACVGGGKEYIGSIDTCQHVGRSILFVRGLALILTWHSSLSLDYYNSLVVVVGGGGGGQKSRGISISRINEVAPPPLPRSPV